MGWSAIFRTAAVSVLVAAFITALAAMSHRPTPAVVLDVPIPSVPDDLSGELRRCSALGPQDAGDPHCQVVWEESRRRFFGGPARPLPPQTSPGTAAPATSSQGDAP